MSAQFDFPPVLDACCGPRMFWFDPKDPRALFIDKRCETHAMDIGTPGTKGRSPSVIEPDIVADFTEMPFPDESFHLVVFDPPHDASAGLTGWLAQKYGKLPKGWQSMLSDGFAECFRVLKPNGTLVFKWADTHVPVSHVLMTTPHKPLFGSRRGRHTHWYVFMKGGPSVTEPASPEVK